MVALMLLSACTESPEESAVDSAVETEDPADWPCGGYAPQTAATLPYGEVSLRYTHAYDNPDEGVGEQVFESIGTREEEGEPVWGYQQHSYAATDEHAVSWDMLTSYMCVDGALIHARQVYEAVRTEGGVESPESYDRVFTQRPVVYIAGMKVGDSWDYDGVFTDTLPDGSTREGTLWFHREVAAEVEVEVPAGTFTALDIEITGPDGGEPEHLYVAWGVGAVKGTSHQLTSWEDFR